MAGDYPSSVKFVSLLTAENPTVTVSYGIYSSGGGIPTCIAFKDGVEIGRQVGTVYDPKAVHGFLLNVFQSCLGTPDVARTVSVKIDTIAPTTAVSGVPSGWSETPVTVTLTADDAGSGVASTEYRLQGAAGWTTYAAPFSVSAQGSSTYEYRSPDVAGNVESTQTFTVRVAAAPTVTSFPPASGMVGTAVTLTGRGFAGAIAVAFNGASAASFSVDSEAQITATVPAGATTGRIAVTTPAGAATSAASFTVIPTPTPTPTPTPPPTVTLKLSGLKSGAWIKATTASATISSTGTYRWKYTPAKKGAYQMQAKVAKTAAYAAATSKWLPFTVK